MGEWAGHLLAILTFDNLQPVRIPDLLGKVRQLAQELMGRFGEEGLGPALVIQSQDVASVSRGEVENRLPQRLYGATRNRFIYCSPVWFPARPWRLAFRRFLSDSEYCSVRGAGRFFDLVAGAAFGRHAGIFSASPASRSVAVLIAREGHHSGPTLWKASWPFRGAWSWQAVAPLVQPRGGVTWVSSSAPM
jgi:hypothetical protein